MTEKGVHVVIYYPRVTCTYYSYVFLTCPKHNLFEHRFGVHLDAALEVDSLR